MNWVDRLLGRREPKPAPKYWKQADRVRLTWDFGEDDDEPVKFTVEAPNAEEARLWGAAAESSHARFAPGRKVEL